MPRTATVVTVGAIIAVLFLNLALPTILPSIPSVRASSRTIWLVGNQSAWNFSLPSGVNPDITVTEGDTITVKLSSADIAHNFFVDVAGNQMWTCPPNVGCSSQFRPGMNATVTFTVNFSPGTYKYLCSYHLGSMKGNFIVLPIPDFSLSSNPSSLIIVVGSTNTSTISVVSTYSASGNVTLTANVSPSGPRLSVYPQIVRLSSTPRSANVTLTVLIPSGTAPSQYTATVTGNNGTASHSATVQVSVPPPDFAIGFSSPSASLLPGSSTSFTITLTSIGFSGTINLSDHVSPSGVNATLSPSTVTVPPEGLAVSLLHLTTSSSTPAGIYNITITGSSTAGQHSTTMTLIVVNPPSDGLPFGSIGLVVIVTVAVLVSAGLTTYLYRRRKPISEPQVSSVV